MSIRVSHNDRENDMNLNAPVCDKCGKKMRYIVGPYGEFYGCSNYPVCNNKEPVVEEVIEQPSEEHIQKLIKEMWG